MNWYIVQAYSGFEKKVIESIKDELKKHKLENKVDLNISLLVFFQSFVPND